MPIRPSTRLPHDEFWRTQLRPELQYTTALFYSSVIIAGERQGHTVRQILEQFKTGYGETVIGLSVVTIVELTHGVQRAKLEERKQRRQAFVDEQPTSRAASKASRPSGE